MPSSSGISGGVPGLLSLAQYYCFPSNAAAWRGGMEAVVELEQWQEVLQKNPGNRERFLAMDRQEFLDVMDRWMVAYCPCDDLLVPGLLSLQRFIDGCTDGMSGFRRGNNALAMAERLQSSQGRAVAGGNIFSAARFF